MTDVLKFPGLDKERAREALHSLDPGQGREDWIRIGCAAKAAGLDLDDFHQWSAEADNYQGAKDVQRAWASFEADGGITAGTLFHFAKQAGWSGSRTSVNKPPAPREPVPRDQKQSRAANVDSLWHGGDKAPADHPYIVQKGGFPDGLRMVTADLDGWGPFRGENLKGWLMVPLWSPLGQLNSIQFIGPGGGHAPQKLNAMGCPLEGMFTTGKITRGSTVAVVEGIGHAWSVHTAGGVAAAVCFGSANMERTAVTIRQSGAEPVLVPDQGKQDKAHDLAVHLRCAVAMLPEDFDGSGGDDINDLHRERGAEAVQAVMQSASVPEPDDSPDMLFPPEAARIAEMLATKPPAREYIIDQLLPRGLTGALVAPGGTGKSFMLMQIATAVASGAPLMGYKVPEPAGVLMLAAEDDQDEVHRRLSVIAGNFEDTEPSPEQVDTLKNLAANLYIQPRVGDENRLTLRGQDGNVVTSPIVERLVATANEIQNLKLIILDPVSRFRSGDENSSEDATRLIEACERIRKQTGATVLLAHHSRKGSAGLQDDIRGASAFVDGLRWAATLHRLNADDAKEFGMEREEAASYLRFQLVKANYVAPQEPIYMTRGEGGRLDQTEAPQSTKGARFQSKADERYHQLLERLKKLIRQKNSEGGQISKRGIRDYAGAEGIFGVGDQTLRGIVSRAITEGEIKAKPSGNGGEILSLW